MGRVDRGLCSGHGENRNRETYAGHRHLNRAQKTWMCSVYSSATRRRPPTRREVATVRGALSGSGQLGARRRADRLGHVARGAITDTAGLVAIDAACATSATAPITRADSLL